ncbi:MAG: hypothetical protein ACFFDG_06510 [Promethearchaeota archaeon]
MIICSNCGATNNETTTHICRKCGALLPLPSKTTRIRSSRVGKEKKKKQSSIEEPVKPSPDKQQKERKELELQEIPKDTELKNGVKLHKIPDPSTGDVVGEPSKNANEVQKKRRLEVLQEITPQPYQGSRVFPSPPPRTNIAIKDALSELKSSISNDLAKKQEISSVSITAEVQKSDSSRAKQERLEKDMTEVLSFLSKKISVKKLEIPKAKTVQKKEPKETIPPSSINEILKRLLTLDLNIEASAIIKTDGTILASAISGKISNSLFATIGMNLSMIGGDIIEGLEAGNLKAISIRGSEGVLDLAPIDKEDPWTKDMILLLFSHPKFKSGIISFAISIVKKQLKEYFELEDKKS